MTPLALLPSWFPTEAAFIALVLGLVYFALTNREDRWAIRLLNPQKAALVALGVFLFVTPDVLTQLPAIPPWLWPVAGAGLVVLALLAEAHVIEIELLWPQQEEGA